MPFNNQAARQAIRNDEEKEIVRFRYTQRTILRQVIHIAYLKILKE